jgi:hypothetical protein
MQGNNKTTGKYLRGLGPNHAGEVVWPQKETIQQKTTDTRANNPQRKKQKKQQNIQNTRTHQPWPLKLDSGQRGVGHNERHRPPKTKGPAN